MLQVAHYSRTELAMIVERITSLTLLDYLYVHAGGLTLCHWWLAGRQKGGVTCRHLQYSSNFVLVPELPLQVPLAPVCPPSVEDHLPSMPCSTRVDMIYM